MKIIVSLLLSFLYYSFITWLIPELNFLTPFGFTLLCPCLIPLFYLFKSNEKENLRDTNSNSQSNSNGIKNKNLNDKNEVEEIKVLKYPLDSKESYCEFIRNLCLLKEGDNGKRIKVEIFDCREEKFLQDEREFSFKYLVLKCISDRHFKEVASFYEREIDPLLESENFKKIDSLFKSLIHRRFKLIFIVGDKEDYKIYHCCPTKNSIKSSATFIG